MPTLASKNKEHKLEIRGPRIPDYSHIKEVADALAEAAASLDRGRSRTLRSTQNGHGR